MEELAPHSTIFSTPRLHTHASRLRTVVNPSRCSPESVRVAVVPLHREFVDVQREGGRMHPCCHCPLDPATRRRMAAIQAGA